MVGEAMLAITMLVDNLSSDLLDGRPVMKVASQRIQGRVEVMLNEMVAMGGASRSTQKRRLAQGLPCGYLVVEREAVHEDRACPQNEEAKYDMLEAIGKLREECAIASEILDPDNWGLSHTELGEKLGLHKATVMRRRNAMYQQYLILIGENE